MRMSWARQHTLRFARGLHCGADLKSFASPAETGRYDVQRARGRHHSKLHSQQ